MTIRLNVARAGQPLFCASCRASQLVQPEVPVKQPPLTTMGPPPQIPDELRRKMPASKSPALPEAKSALETVVAFVHPNHRYLLYGQDLAPPPVDIGRRSLSYNVPIQSSSVGVPHYGLRGEILSRIPGTIAAEEAHRARTAAQPVTSPQTGLTPAESIVIPASDRTDTAEQVSATEDSAAWHIHKVTNRAKSNRIAIVRLLLQLYVTVAPDICYILTQHQ